jgi:iron complex outermembrane receptor protein
MRRVGKNLSLAVLISVTLCAESSAQTTPQIAGTVKDQSGAVLAGVAVTVTRTDTDTSTTRTVVTGEVGTYLLSDLPIGLYVLEASLPGFRTFGQTGIVLQAGSSLTINPVLEVGEITQRVEVQALVETRSGQDLLPGGLVNRRSRTGILGDKTVMEIPYSQTSLSSRALELFDDGSLPMANVLQNNPSIRSSTSSPMYSDFSMRGVNMNGNHMLLNGVPSLFSQFTTPPTHIIERIDITSGPNAAVNGVAMSNNGTDSGATPAPGVINVVTKSAPENPVNRYIQTFSGRSNFGEYLDVARRFGAARQWGVRVNAEFMNGGLSLPGAENNTNDVFVNLDHRSTHSATNVFAGYVDLRIDGAQRWFIFSGRGSELPEAPRSRTNYDFPETTKWQRGHVMTFNHVHKLKGRWSLFANIGSQNKSGYKYNASAALRFDDPGNFVTANIGNAQDESTNNLYGQVGVRGNLQTRAIAHTLAVALDSAWARYWNTAVSSATGLIGGGLSGGIVFRPGFYPLPALREGVPQWIETNVGMTVADTVSYKKVDVLLAASLKHEDFLNQVTGQSIVNNNVLPTYGVTYKVSTDLSAYVGHTESFSRGSIVANDARFVNRGETLPPVRSIQNEVGLKLQRFGMLTTLAYFDMDQQNLIDVPLSATTFRRDADGKNRYKGVELAAVGQLADRWTVTTGVLCLDAVREKTSGGSNDGKWVNGVATWSGTFGAEFRPIASLGLVGRAVYNGEARIDNAANAATTIPAFVAIDAGANYQLRAGAMPLKLIAMVYNAANRDYWMGRGGSTTFGLSMPRTLMMSAQVDF